MKVLILHAGGYSKRLPSHSCSGKIFRCPRQTRTQVRLKREMAYMQPLSSPLPIESSGPPYQMLDLKLALYLPFLNVMEPGVFIAASDTIEVFCPKNVRD